MIDELLPDNDNDPIAPYRFNWLECFLVLACITITIITIYQGVTGLAMALAGL